MARCQFDLHNGRLQFKVDEPTVSIKTDLPANSYTIPDTGGDQVLLSLNVVIGSVEVYMDGTIMPMGVLDVQSYSVTYDTGSTLIEFYTGPDDPGLQTGQLIIIKLQYKTPLV